MYNYNVIDIPNNWVSLTHTKVAPNPDVGDTQVGRAVVVTSLKITTNYSCLLTFMNLCNALTL